MNPTIGCFAGLPWRERLHVRVRWATCPVPAVEAEVPRSGRVLEVGCGHGLVSVHLALTSSDREVTGTDIDARKIDLARTVAARLPPAARFQVEHRPDGSLPAGPWDAIVLVDVLYLLAPAEELALLDACVDRLAPGGVIVAKEADVEPRWKHRLATAQEHLATRVLRITEGDTVAFTPVSDLASHLRSGGLEVRTRRADRGYLHPHALLTARRPD